MRRRSTAGGGQPVQVASANPNFAPGGATAYAPGGPSQSVVTDWDSAYSGTPQTSGDAIANATTGGASDAAVTAAAAGDPKAAAMATYVNASPSGSQDRIAKLAKLAALPGLGEGQQKVVNLLMQRELDSGKLPDAVKQYLFAKTPQGGGFQGTFADFQKKSQDRGDTIESAITARAKLAPQYGLQPGTPAYQQFVLGGKVPEPDAGPSPEMKATEQKMFATAQEKTRVLQSQITDLNHALELNNQAYSGNYQPGLAAGIARNAPFGLGSLVVDPNRVAATTEFNNLVGGATLSQGKELFGSRITNYDEKLLQDLKARPDMTPQERSVIINNMIAHRQQIFAETQQDVSDMRAGTRFQKGPAAVAPAPVAPAPQSAPQAAPSGPLLPPSIRRGQPPFVASAPQQQPGSGAPAPQSSGAPIRVNTPQEAASLPSGTTFITPDGQTRVRH